jgi:hypothetical protein
MGVSVMARYAIVKNGTVTNVVEWDGVSNFQVDGELIVADETSYIGQTYDGSFIPRPPEVDIRSYDERRKAEYPHLDDLIVALWESVVEERMASVTALEILRQTVKSKYPKP